MKKNLLILMSLCLFMLQSKAQMNGYILSETAGDGITSYCRYNYVSDMAEYTPPYELLTDGLTFSYSEGWFTQAPCVRAGIELLTGYDPLATYTAVIIANTTTQTVVRVQKIVGGVISEPGAGEILVHLYALGVC